MSVAEDLKKMTPEQLEAREEERAIKKELQKRRIKKVVDAMERPAVSLPDILTLRERLARRQPDVAWRIADVQGAGHRVLLAAQFKAGKTTFVVNVIRCLVDGDPFLSRYAVAPIEGTVVLFDFEMSDRQLDDWYRFHGILNDDRVLVIPMRGAASTFDLQDEHWREHWVRFLREHDVKYLVLDCLRPVLDALGLNEHTETGLFLTAFDQLLRDADIPEALVVHHMGHQNERARGDSRLLDWPDVGWTLVRQKAEDGADDLSAPRFFKAYGRDVDVSETALAYRNERRAKGETIRVIDEEEAAIVREIFSRYAAGDGAYTIAAALNSRAALSPRAQQGRPSGWSVSTIRDVLKRPLYRGEFVWGRTKSAYGRELGKVAVKNKREKGQIPTPEETWIRLPVNDDLRIVDAELAARADARRLDRRTRYLTACGKNNGKMPEKAWGKYLLTGGMLICSTCGGHFEGLRYPKEVYVCSTRRRKPGACTNTMAFPMAQADANVLELIEGEILGTRYIEELLALVDQGDSDNVARLTSDRDRLRGEIENLVRSIAVGVPADTVAPGIRERELEISRIEQRLRTPRQQPNIERLRDALMQRAAEWKQTLRTEPRVARLLLRRLIGPIELYDASKPEWQMPEFIQADAVVKTGLIDGLAEIHDVASPAGFEPAFWP